MANRRIRSGVLACTGALVGFGLTLLWGGGGREPATHDDSLPPVSANRELQATASRDNVVAEVAALPDDDIETIAEAFGTDWRTAPVQDFKRALYELDIDSVDRLEELERFVAIGDADPRSFWDTDWTGIDDWKERPDDFRLERTDDGALIFIPGEQSRRTYTFFETMNEYAYDEDTGEFVYETDFYGKPITNIVKFLRDDVMVMMVVSGDKVDLNLYGPHD